MISKPNQRAFPVMPGPRASGLTKREYFAAAALQGLLADSECTGVGFGATAVKYADELIEALNVGAVAPEVPVDEGGNEGGT